MIPLRRTWLSRMFPSSRRMTRRSQRITQHRNIEALESRMLLSGDPILDKFVTTEHSDMRVGYTSGGGWTYTIGEDLQGIMPPDEALLYVGNNAALARPAGSDWDFTGVASGDDLYFGGQVQQDGHLYLGAAAYDVDLSLVATTDISAASKGRQGGNIKWVKFSLLGVEHTNPDGTAGTGSFSIWSSGSFGAPTVLVSSYDDGVANPNGQGFDSTDGISADDTWWLNVGGHAHYNFGFSAPGRYEVQMQTSVELAAGGTSTSSPVTLYFSVGSVGRVEFDMSSYNIAEDGGSATITVERVGGSDGQITVDYATSDGTATAGSDYTAASGSFTFLDGETSKQIVIPVIADVDAEGDETINLTLSSPGPETIVEFLDFHEDGLLGTQSTATLTINDVVPNSEPTISPIDNQYIGQDTSTGAIGFTVGDGQTAAGALAVSAVSSNTTLVPNGNIVLGGSGANRTITVTPAAGLVGATTITVTVTDEGGLEATATFDIGVAAHRLVPFGLPTYSGGEVNSNAWNSVTGDFNGDGIVDIVLGGSIENAVTYLQGNGDGTFQPEQVLNAGTGMTSGGVVAIDYDGDSDLDFLSIERNQATTDGTADEGTITLYRNDGSANFTREIVKSGLLQGVSIAAGDLNGDGLADVAWGEYRFDSSGPAVTSSQSFALQQVGGQLGTTTKLTDAAHGEVQIGDVDGDGNADIVTSGTVYNYDPFSSAPELKVFLGNGDGTVAAAAPVASGASPYVQQIVDLNGDGREDLLVYDRPSGVWSHLGYYPQMEDGSFGARVDLMLNYLYSQHNVASDMNGDNIPDIVSYSYNSGSYRVTWSPGLGDGTFGAPILVQANPGGSGLIVADVDNDSNPDIIAVGSITTERTGPVSVYLNKTGEDPMVLLPPAARTRVAGDPIDLQVYFGFPITVSGTPRVALDVGGNTVYAEYVSGSGTPTLTFRYTVGATDLDLDGVQLASNIIDLNGGTLTDPIGGPAVLQFPSEVFNGVFVNAVGPLVQMISRVDTTPTEAATVRFNVQFSEDVTGVDVTDFAVRMTEGNLAGATVDSVTPISASLYEVTVSTGTGTGALGLSVNEGATITDLESDVLAKGYAGGEVYTVRQQPIGPISTYYTHGHADYRPIYENDEFSFIINPDDSLLSQPTYPSDEVITYLDSTAIVDRAAGSEYDFLGVADGEDIYISNSSGSVVTVPYLGWEGGSLPRDVFSDYRPSDPRITSSTLREYVSVQVVNMRSSSGGDFSMWSGSSTPTVWVATSDGIGETDKYWLYPGAHLHRNVAFTKAGTYEIDVVVSGYLDTNANNVFDPDLDVYVESGIHTMVFHVDTLGARDDAFMVVGDGALTGSVSLNDAWDAALGTPTASVVSTTTDGTLTLEENGSFRYQPSATFSGSDSFVYQLTNSRGGVTTATVTITESVEPVFGTILGEDHADIGVNFEDGEWDLHIHDEENEAEYEPDEALLYIGADSRTTRTGDAADPAYDFLGVAAGGTVFVSPQIQNPNLLFLGLGAEELATGVLQGDIAKLRLASVSGPGEFSMWQSGLTATEPNLFMATSDGIDENDSFDVTAGSHNHMNFGFTSQGLYEITFVAMGIDAEGTPTDSGQVTYYFFVGPTLEVTPVVPSISEGADTSAVTKVADIVVTDYGQGANVLSLTGADAALFEIVGNELFLRAGVSLDYETNASLDVTVNLDDVGVGASPDGSADLSFPVLDVNEGAQLKLSKVTSTLPVNVNTQNRVFIETITISDVDAGTNVLSLSGADADLFEIVGNTLYLKADTVLDIVNNPVLDVTVSVDDSEIGSGPEHSVDVSVRLTDPSESPLPSLGSSMIGFVNGNWWLSSADENNQYSYQLAAETSFNPAHIVENVQGDFNGDGIEDVAIMLTNGQWYVGLIDDAGQMTFQLWTTWRTSDVKEINVGDFNGDGMTDIVGIFRNGSGARVWVFESTGTEFLPDHYGNYGSYDGITTTLIGNFDGVNGDDIAIFNTVGCWWVGLTDPAGTQISYGSPWARWSVDRSIDNFNVGDFNGDNVDDILAVFDIPSRPNDYNVFVGLSSPSRFTTSAWQRITVPESLDAFLIGDFNGDMNDDFAAMVNGRRWWVGESNGTSGFDYTSWATVPTGPQVHSYFVGDSNNDGVADIFSLDANGDWWSKESNLSSFATRLIDDWAAVDWKFVSVGAFNQAPQTQAADSVNDTPPASADDFGAFGDSELLEMLNAL